MAKQNKIQNNNPNTCSRCGTCCLKGGPALHHEDKELVAQHIIQRKQLVTIRQGELALAPNVSNSTISDKSDKKGGDSQLILTEHELIKIKGLSPNDWTCIFFKKLPTEQQAQCTIHPQHPFECKQLFCQDPSKLLISYQQTRLCRADLSSQVELAIQNAYEQGLKWQAIGTELAQWYKNNSSALNTTPKTAKEELSPALEQKILEAARFDHAFRELCLERQVLEPNELDFHLGRSVKQILLQFSINLSANMSKLFL